ncbi:MAG: transporter substrate-binding domain-containing protein [Sneathiella sp.]
MQFCEYEPTITSQTMHDEKMVKDHVMNAGKKAIFYFLLFTIFLSSPLAAQQQIFIVIGDQEPIFRYTDDTGQTTGIDIEIIDLIMKELKIPYKFNLIKSTARGVAEAKSGKADMLMSKIMKEDRKLYLTYPQENYRNIAWNFFIRKEDEGKIKYDSLDDLKGLRVGATKSFAYTEEFWAADLDLDVIPSNDKQLKKLINNRFDIVPMTTLSTLHKAKNNGQIDKIAYLPKVLVYTKLYNIFTKASTYPNKEELIREYDIALKKLKKSGQIQAIFDKYNYRE